MTDRRLGDDREWWAILLLALLAGVLWQAIECAARSVL